MVEQRWDLMPKVIDKRNQRDIAGPQGSGSIKQWTMWPRGEPKRAETFHAQNWHRAREAAAIHFAIEVDCVCWEGM